MPRLSSAFPPLALGLFLLPLAGASASPTPAADASASPAPRIFGAWAFNARLTEQLAQRDRPGGMGGGHRGGFGHGDREPRGDGRFRGGSGGAGEREAGGPPISGLIFSTTPEGAVLLTDDGGRTRRFAPGAGAARDPAAADGAEVAARWDPEGDLVVEIRPDRGPRRTETYIVDHEKKHLYVTTVVTSGFGSRSRTLAFDPVDPATLPPPSAGSPGR